MAFEIIERVYSGNWFFSSYNTRGFVQYYPDAGGGDFLSKFVAVNKKHVCEYIFDINEFNKSADFAVNKLVNDHKWRSDIYKKIDSLTKQYFEAGERLRRMDLSMIPDHELVEVIKDIIPLQRHHIVYSIIVNGVVPDCKNHLSNVIKDELKNKIGEKNLEKYWSILTLVTRMSLRQRKEYEIALLAGQAGKKTEAEINKELEGLHDRYCWLTYQYQGPAATIEQFKEELDSAIRKNVHLNLPQQLQKIKRQQEKIMSKLKFDDRSRFLIELAQNVLLQKAHRKDVQYHGLYCYEPLFKELARRKGIENWKTVTFLFPWEMGDFILKDEPSAKELEERKEYSCFIVSKDSIEMKVGKDAQDFVKTLNLKEEVSNIDETKGHCAYAGKARGRVKIINTPADMYKLEEGDILVSQATSPDLLPAMVKAAAFVTNTGGLICHAAIVSRELKKPCIVGTTNATLIFKDNDMVEVDATKGIIRRLK